MQGSALSQVQVGWASLMPLTDQGCPARLLPGGVTLWAPITLQRLSPGIRCQAAGAARAG